MVSEVSDADVHVLFEQHTTTELISFVKNNVFTYVADVDCYTFSPSWYEKLISKEDDEKVNKVIQHRSEMLNRLNMIYNSFKDGYNIGLSKGFDFGFEKGHEWSE